MNKVPPHSIEIEKAVLGAILLEPEAMFAASEILKPEMFYHTFHQVLFQTFSEMQLASQPINFILVIDYLKSRKRLEAAGGAFYVTNHTSNVVSSTDTVRQCRKIVDKYLLREQIKIAGELLTKAYDEASDPFENLEAAEKNLHELTLSINQNDSRKIDTVLISVIQELEEQRHRTDPITGYTTGFRTLDNYTMGWHKTDLSIIAARPAVGKTAFTLQLAINTAFAGHPVAFFSLEMGAEQLVKRVLASQAKMYLSKLRAARLNDNEMQHLVREGVQPIAALPFYIDDTASLSVAQFKARLRRMVRTKGVKIAFVDYLQLLKSSVSKNSSRQQQIGDVSRELKITAKELNVPIIALSQLSREVEKRASGTPQLSDIREAGDIEQDADNVFFLYGHSEQEILNDASLAQKIYVKIAKQRNGSLTNIEFSFDRDYQTFSDGGEAKETVKLKKINDDPF